MEVFLVLNSSPEVSLEELVPLIQGDSTSLGVPVEMHSRL